MSASECAGPSTRSAGKRAAYTFSDFERLFNDALATYAIETGKDLRTDPLASTIYKCDSPDTILAVLREALKLDGRRNDDFKLAKRLRLVVSGLYALPTSSALRVGSHSVSHSKLAICLLVYPNS